MTDNLEEAKRHIEALLRACSKLDRYGMDTTRGDQQAAQAFLDSEGQTVEGGDEFAGAGDFTLRDVGLEMLIAELAGWAETEGMSDDGRRKIYLMREAAAELTHLKSSQAEHDRKIRDDALETAARWHIERAERCQTVRTEQHHRASAKAIRSLKSQPVEESGGVEDAR
jgi:hypothetical protein